jgi:hypothetical protein
MRRAPLGAVCCGVWQGRWGVVRKRRRRGLGSGAPGAREIIGESCWLWEETIIECHREIGEATNVHCFRFEEAPLVRIHCGMGRFLALVKRWFIGVRKVGVRGKGLGVDPRNWWGLEVVG